MIGQYLALLCVAFGIVAGSCCQVPQVLSSQFVGSPVVSAYSGNNFYGSGIAGYTGGIFSAGSFATNGPETAPLPVVQAPSVTLPVVQSPVVALPSQPIPVPRVISQRCVCTKTVVKPQIIQRQVTVPKIQRYLKRTVTPIVENVAFKTSPICRCNARSSYSRVC